MKKIIYLLFAAIILVLAYAFYEYNRGQEQIDSKEARISVSSGDLIEAFENNETQANSQYLNQIISVSGSVEDIQNQGDSLITIYLSGQGVGLVACEMNNEALKKEQLPSLGHTIQVNGICTGYLMDVVLVNCVFTQSR